MSLKNKIRNIISSFFKFIIIKIGATCGNCIKYNEIECGIVCDDCAGKHNTYQKANREIYFCASYQGRKF